MILNAFRVHSFSFLIVAREYLDRVACSSRIKRFRNSPAAIAGGRRSFCVAQTNPNCKCFSLLDSIDTLIAAVLRDIARHSRANSGFHVRVHMYASVNDTSLRPDKAFDRCISCLVHLDLHRRHVQSAIAC